MLAPIYVPAKASYSKIKLTQIPAKFTVLIHRHHIQQRLIAGSFEPQGQS